MGMPRQMSSEGISPQDEILNEIKNREQNARSEWGDTSDETQRLVVAARGLGIPQTTILENQIEGIRNNSFLPKSQIKGILELFNKSLKEEQVKEQISV